ncbi:uncharacterized protein [Aegilops tauschii subsp. strangulata]|uniref:uncharacterized protein n=1 Tax=Aegilops tauschii subsp. strangulata TaxID=200361 RepID=UPI003CC8D3BB
MHSDIFRGITSVGIGNGLSILFWKDLWLDEEEHPLMHSFPRAISFCTDEDATVDAVLQANEPSKLFQLPLSAQAREEAREIQGRCAHVGLVTEEQDVWVCSIANRFSSSIYYKHCFREVEADETFVWLWKAKSPIKFKVFRWLPMVDRMNTRNKLKRHHYNIQNNNYACLLCNQPPEETVEHLFFHCPFSVQCWAKLGITWPSYDNRLRLIHAGKQQWSQPLFLDIFMLSAWSIWKERNNEHFRRVPHSFSSWLACFKSLVELLVHNCKQELHPFISMFPHSL